MTTEDLIKNIKAAGFNVEEDRGYTYVNNVTTQEEYDKLESIVREAVDDDYEPYELKAYLIGKRTWPWYRFRTSYQGRGFTPFEFEMLGDMINLDDYNWGTAEDFITEIQSLIHDEIDPIEDENRIRDYNEVIEWLKTEDPNKVFAVCWSCGDGLDSRYSFKDADGGFTEDVDSYFIGYIIPEVEEYEDEDE